jgi:hypothetical protein
VAGVLHQHQLGRHGEGSALALCSSCLVATGGAASLGMQLHGLAHIHGGRQNPVK